jgi:hypothetical protein
MATGIKSEFLSLPDAQASDKLKYKGWVNLFPVISNSSTGESGLYTGNLFWRSGYALGMLLSFLVLGI